MGQLKLILDQDGSGEDFDRLLKNTFTTTGNPAIITKAKGTEKGKAAVMITFPIAIGAGIAGRACVVMTARELVRAAEAVAAVHPESLSGKAAAEPVGTIKDGVHRGRVWNAALVEKVYLVRVEGSDMVSFAFNEEELLGVAQASVDLVLEHEPPKPAEESKPDEIGAGPGD